MEPAQPHLSNTATIVGTWQWVMQGKFLSITREPQTAPTAEEGEAALVMEPPKDTPPQVMEEYLYPGFRAVLELWSRTEERGHPPPTGCAVPSQPGVHNNLCLMWRHLCLLLPSPMFGS